MMIRMIMALLSICFVLIQLTHESVMAQEQPAQLRVLTYNLLHDGPWSGFFENGTHLEERLDMTIQELQRLELDVIALQEASDSRKHGNVSNRIADALGYQMVFEPTTQHIFGIGLLDRLITSAIGFKEGPAILSRHPISPRKSTTCLAANAAWIPASSYGLRSMHRMDRSKSFRPIPQKVMSASSGESENCSVNIKERGERF